VKLPKLDRLIIEREKVADYLLNPTHRYGASKARFFGEFGFQRKRWKILAKILHENARNNEVVQTIETGFGPRFVVEGEVRAPNGRRMRLRTIWQFDRGEIAPRLITAYPGRQT
jgi:uncharacterized protein DUF6883